MNLNEYEAGFCRTNPDQEDLTCFQHSTAHEGLLGNLPPLSHQVTEAADLIAAAARARGFEMSKGSPNPKLLADFDRDLESLLDAHAFIFAASPEMKNEVMKKIHGEYNQGRLESFQETLLGLAIERGRLLGRRSVNFDELKELDKRISRYRTEHAELLRVCSGAQECIASIMERGEQRGIEKCLSAERTTAELWTMLMGSTEQYRITRPIAHLFSRKGAALLCLAGLSPRRRALVRESFNERYGRDLLDICARLMKKREFEFAGDLLQGTKIEAATSGIAYFLSQRRRARGGTKILQEMKRLVEDFSATELVELDRHFSARYGVEFSVQNLAHAFHKHMKYFSNDSEHIANAIVSGQRDRVHALLFHRLLSGKKNERKEAADLLEELTESERAGLERVFPLEFKGLSARDFAEQQLAHNQGLKELIIGLFNLDESRIALARLCLGLEGDREEWPGTPFLGKSKEEGEALIRKFDEIFGAGRFHKLLKKYNSSDVSLVKALINDKLAPAAEIYFASTNGLGSDIESLRLLLSSSTAEQIQRDEKEYEALWETRASRPTLFAKRIYYRYVQPAAEQLLDRSNYLRKAANIIPVGRYLGALFGKLKDVVWLNSQGDEWKELEVLWGGRTDDIHRLYKRACQLAEHELALPAVSLISGVLEWASGREVPLDKLISHEAGTLRRDYELLQNTYFERMCDPKHSPTRDEITHLRASIDRLTTDRLAFRERKRYLGHTIASAGAGFTTSVTGLYLLLRIRLSIPTVMVACFFNDFLVRSGIKMAIKGPGSCSGEERFNDLAHSGVNCSTFYARKLPKAVGLMRRLIADPILERGADFASKIGGKWTFSNIIRRMVRRRIANHALTPDELKRGIFEDESIPSLCLLEARGGIYGIKMEPAFKDFMEKLDRCFQGLGA